MNKKNFHPTFSELADYLDQRLDHSAMEQIDNHLLSDCSTCQEDFLWLQQITGQMQKESEWYDAPTMLIQQIQDSFTPARKQPMPTLITWLQRLKEPIYSYSFATLSLVLLLLTFLSIQSEKRSQLLSLSVQRSDQIQLYPPPVTDKIDQQNQFEERAIADQRYVTRPPQPHLPILSLSSTPTIETLFLLTKVEQVANLNRSQPDEIDTPPLVISTPLPPATLIAAPIIVTPTLITDQSTEPVAPPAAIAPTVTPSPPPRYTPPDTHFPSP